MAKVTWILVADRSRAKLLHQLSGGQGPYPTLSCWSHEAGRLQPWERDAEEPGRIIHPAGYASAVEPHEDRDHVEARRFAKELVDHLELSRQEHRFDRLLVIAPPKFLGVLRQSWTPSLEAMIDGEWNEDLAGFSEADLQRRLEALETTESKLPVS